MQGAGNVNIIINSNNGNNNSNNNQIAPPAPNITECVVRLCASEIAQSDDWSVLQQNLKLAWTKCIPHIIQIPPHTADVVATIKKEVAEIMKEKLKEQANHLQYKSLIDPQVTMFRKSNDQYYAFTDGSLSQYLKTQIPQSLVELYAALTSQPKPAADSRNWMDSFEACLQKQVTVEMVENKFSRLATFVFPMVMKKFLIMNGIKLTDKDNYIMCLKCSQPLKIQTSSVKSQLLEHCITGKHLAAVQKNSLDRYFTNQNRTQTVTARIKDSFRRETYLAGTGYTPRKVVSVESRLLNAQDEINNNNNNNLNNNNGGANQINRDNNQNNNNNNNNNINNVNNEINHNNNNDGNNHNNINIQVGNDHNGNMNQIANNNNNNNNNDNNNNDIVELFGIYHGI
jgi:hypothetical protein